MAASAISTSMWSPLKQQVFRALWIASAISSVGTWMHDVGAAWLMTTLAPNSPILVALLQAASSLPFFLLALPAGAIADVVDRRQVLLYTQSWMLLVATSLGLLTVTGIVAPSNPASPWILLGLTFAMSIGSSMNMPVWQAVTPELVTKEELPQAVTLSGIVVNLSRSIGPALAGIIIASAGTGVVFLLNAASFISVIWVIYTWKRVHQQSVLPAERVVGAIQAGVRYVSNAPVFQSIIFRTIGYIFFASALFALLPLLARKELKLDALGYGIILGFWGIGGLAGAFVLPKLRQKFSIDRIVAGCSAVMGLMMLIIASQRNFYITCAVMLLVGISSLGVMVSLNVAAQSAVPNWVKARALSVQLLVFQGGMSLGSLLWGTLAQHTTLSTSLAAAGIGLLVAIFITARFRLKCSELLDLRASLHWDQPTHAFEPCPNDGPVLVTLEYYIDPNKAEEFTLAMQALAQIRRRDGAIQWGLYQDVSNPSRFVETALVESWAEHRRQFERVTVSDKVIEDRVLAYHIGSEAPKVSEMLYSKKRVESAEC
ncbi:MFS transporter [Dulcicalothrix desertica PCC 7102]|uniref:MFS transporter n=1 Tax=Dulcicalothrix desertica PCC 7102 TaxID=232991 RepID=A0A433VFG8_9CYAN|nr:MFS transporter [Dulcicalothrix desertica]RUT04834.1 MFS transporter [Dulcicalothrix desertica PCC 7102]TWH42845.1 putative MFS family arabinose efflux permease [Dulcicalothrix desertica PCC 7102]